MLTTARRAVFGVALCAVLAALPSSIASAGDPPTIVEQMALPQVSSAGLVARVDTHGLIGTYSFALWPGTGPEPADAAIIPAALPPDVTPPPLPTPPPGVTWPTPPPAPPGEFVYAYASGLVPGGQYTAQFTVTTDDGTVTGAPLAFTTSTTEPIPPGVPPGGGLPSTATTTRPPAPAHCTVPTLVGHTLTAARQRLSSAHFRALKLHLRIVHAHTRRRGPARVVSQTPRALSTVAAGATLTVRVTTRR